MQDAQEKPRRPTIDLFAHVAICRLASYGRSKHKLTVHCSVLLYHVAARRLTLPFLLPGQAKGLVVICHNLFCLSIEKGRAMQHFGDNFIVVVPEDHLLHTPEQPFCGDPTCPCVEDTDALTELDQAIKDGLITTDDATRILQGRTV
jgi:hypothetical protein